MKTTVNSADLQRILAMIPIAPNQMCPEDFTAFIQLAGASVAVVGFDCSFIRVADQLVFKSLDGVSGPKFGKVACIKAIREVTGVGLKEAKDCSDGMWLEVSLTAEQVKHLKSLTPGVLYEVK